jgi:hypothetical protein
VTIPGKVTVREIATGQEFLAWPVDARELVRTGEYDTPEWSNHAAPAFPLKGQARGTKGQAAVAEAVPAEAAPTVAPVASEPVPVVFGTVEIADVQWTGAKPDTDTGPAPAKRGRKPKA